MLTWRIFKKKGYGGAHQFITHICNTLHNMCHCACMCLSNPLTTVPHFLFELYKTPYGLIPFIGIIHTHLSLSLFCLSLSLSIYIYIYTLPTIRLACLGVVSLGCHQTYLHTYIHIYLSFFWFWCREKEKIN